MTLYRQLILAITFLIACLMAGNFLVSVLNARGYVFDQLQVHAQDTATSLGLTISHAAQNRDAVQVRSFVDVVFDRGYYHSITYRKLSGEVEVERQAEIEIEGVPQWFIHLVNLPEPSGRAEVISGWFRLGEVEVISHPGFAYRDLWRVFCNQLAMFLFSAVVCYCLAGLGLAFLLKPLRRVEAQAEAICHREFPVQETLPRTRELRRMVEAMNRMVKKVQSIFQEQVALSESLREQVYLDPVTGLLNRTGFDARLDSSLGPERAGSAGILLLIQLGGLQALNQRAGRDMGDQCLKAFADALKLELASRELAVTGRRAGADLCVFAPVLDQQEAEALAESLFRRLLSVPWLTSEAELQLYMGAAFSSSLTREHALLTQADQALGQAQHLGVDNFQWYRSNTKDTARPAREWRELLQTAIDQRRFSFHVQPVFEANGRQVSQLEVFCRLAEGDELLPAGVFWPMAERFGMTATIDRLMIEQLAAQAPEHLPLCVNLSPLSIADADFVLWLEQFLATNSEFAARLLLELPEYALSLNEAGVREFGRRMVARGARLSLDHFGVGTSAFSYLQSLPLYALKVDRSFIQGIENHGDHRFFVKSLLQIAHSCEINLLVEGVETEAEWTTLLALGINGGQGYYLARPMTLDAWMVQSGGD